MLNLKKNRANTKFIKYLFLSSSCSIIIAIIATLYFQNISSDPTTDPTPEKSKQLTLPKEYSLTISQSSFEGVNNKSMPYKILAQSVAKDLDNKYMLSSVSGTYHLDDGELTIKSNNGVLDEDNKYVILSKHVSLAIDGVVFNSDRIKFDLANQEAHCDDKVEVTFNKSSIKADSFDTKDSNNIIEFKGNVESNFNIKNSK